MAVSNEYPRNMDLRLPVAASLCTIFILISLAESRPKNPFIPKKTNCVTDNAISVICNSTDNYPEHKIRKLLQRNRKRFAQLSGSVVQPAKNDFVPMLKFNDDSIEEGNLCRTKKVTVVPKVGFGAKMEPKFIANIPEFEQVVEYEICVDRNKGCFENDVLPQDFKTFCQQTYTWVRLVSLTRTGKLEYAAIRVPSTCVCSYKRELF